MRIFSRRFGCLLATAPTVTFLPSTAHGSPADASGPRVSASSAGVSLDVPSTHGSPGYSVTVPTGGQVALTTGRSGPAVLAAPNPTASATRDIRLPAGTWYDVNRGRTVKGPVTLEAYATPPTVTPAFVNLRAQGADKALAALRR
nr:hypothetical protein OG999_08990 [Streptomyces sp. NBC_00886]